jgi:hypothetical protein
MKLETLFRWTLTAAIATGCSADDKNDAAAAGEGTDPTVDQANPFTAAPAGQGKEDTAYSNPDGVEVEVDIEADLEGAGYRSDRGPAELGQFAVTYLRKNGDFYLESLAEHVASRTRVEWLVDTNWVTAEQAKAIDATKLTHFRIRGVNAVLLNSASSGAQLGKVFEAVVPLKPYSIMTDAGDTCADDDDHMSLSQSVYWYRWDPSNPQCKVATQKMKVTVSKTFQAAQATYPEYDKLTADGKVTAVVIFGQIGDGAITESDPGMYAFRRMGTWLKEGGFKEAATAPVGKRYTKHIGSTDVEVDLYSPNDFSGLGDYAHFANFQKALSEHEIVVYDGHSMLGASDFWARPQYNSDYQIFLYGGCLGYEYYVKPIVDGKKGFENVDIMSSVVEVTANAVMFAGPAMAKIFEGLGNGYKTTWRDILVSVRRGVGDSTFGASGVRDNCFTPTGSRCGGDAPVDGGGGEAVEGHYESATAVAIPDNTSAGIKSVITVPETFTVKTVTVDVNVEHTYVGDLKIVLKKGRKSATVWANEGDSQKNIEASFDLGGFSGVDAKGDWTLSVVDSAAQDTGTLKSWALTLGR